MTALLNTDFQFEQLKKKVMEDFGFQTQYYGEKHLKRRFRIRMRAQGAKTPREYMKVLESDPAEYPKLLDTLTVNLTEWFRNPQVYSIIKNRVIPNIIDKGFDFGEDLQFKKYKGKMLPCISEKQKAQRRKYLRFWSVGCSDGKEPYSLVMCLKDVIGDSEAPKVTVFAWDIDKQMLEKGRKGLYKSDDLKGLDKEHLKKYFIKKGNGYRVCEEIRSLVTFEKKDLHVDRKRQWIDLIVCRNVVIYLTKQRKSDLYLELYNSLRPGGYYIMGMSETLMGRAKDFYDTFDNINRIYQKPFS